jgi:hypothetical protein
MTRIAPGKPRGSKSGTDLKGLHEGEGEEVKFTLRPLQEACSGGLRPSFKSQATHESAVIDRRYSVINEVCRRLARQLVRLGRTYPGRGSAATVLAAFLSVATTTQGQEAVRMSMASAQAAEARSRNASTSGYYNLQLGPTTWRFGSGLGLEYNDNVNYLPKAEGDFILRPQINARMFLPVTDRNSLSLTLGGGYAAYIEHPELSRVFVTPDSELSFDLYVGDFWINLHDRFSITESVYQDPTVTGAGDFSQLQNTLGAAALWDLNKVILRMGYDHTDYTSLTGDQRQRDGQSEIFSASAGYALKPGMLLGVELGGGFLRYTGTNFSNASQWNVGCLFQTPVSEYIQFKGSAGYTVYMPEAGGSMGTASDFSGFYAQIALTHRLNRYLDYSLSGGRSINSSYYGGTFELYQANLRANWKILHKISLGTSLNYEHGTQLTAGSEVFTRYGAGITLGRAITRKLSGSLGYQFYWRESDLPDRNYTVNILSLNFNYAF